MNKQELATRQFFAWLKIYHPDVFSRVDKSVLIANGIGDWTSIFTAVTNAAIAYDTNKTTRKQIDINIARAQAGQPPVSFDSSGNPVSTIPATTGTGITLTGQNNNVVLYGALAVLVAALIYLVSTRRAGARR